MRSVRWDTLENSLERPSVEEEYVSSRILLFTGFFISFGKENYNYGLKLP